MKRFWLPVLLAVPAMGAATPFVPRMRLTVEPASIVLTETATAVVTFDLPGRLYDNPSFAADAITRATKIELANSVVRVNGTNLVRYVARFAVAPQEPGRTTIGPVTVGLPVRGNDIFAMFERREQRFRSNAAHLFVYAPPEHDAPANYVGAIASNLVVSAALDAHVCTAGDPLVLTVDVAGMTDVSRVRTPRFEPAFRGTPFKLDAASVRSETHGNARRFTWRVRALEAGTVEFPALAVSYFDIPSRSFREVRTEPIPIQIKAGAQVVLGGGVEGDAEDDAYPMPDGLDMDFPTANAETFTLKRAFARATAAVQPEDFAAAADVYREYLDQLDRRVSGGRGFWFQVVTRCNAETIGRHYANLGALETLAERPKEAWRAFSRAEWFTGATPTTVRGLRAAYARLKGSPRVELPAYRLMGAFWFKWALRGRVLSVLGALLGLAFFFWIALKAGRRLAAFAAVLFAAWSAFAAGTARLEPSAVAVGQPAAFVFTFRAGPNETVESLQFGGLPEAGDGLEYGAFETLTNNAFRLPVRFLKPFRGTLNVVAQGMKTTRRGNANSFFSSSHSFGERLPPFTVDVRPLPAAGRPADFSGAVATRFTLTQRADPERVHPGDLVTVTYQLAFDGYFPTNVQPRLVGAPADLKLYDLKETARTRTSVTWTQMMVPKTTAATNTPAASLDWYDLRGKRYAVAAAPARRLAFVSATAASTQNAAVMVDGNGGDASAVAPSVGQAIVLRFAPSERSPAVATLPAGTPVEELHRTDRGWRRVSAASACGWTK